MLVAAVMGVPGLAGAAPDAGAAVRPVAGCPFSLGAISQQGAAGTLFFAVTLNPSSPAEACTVSVTFSVSVQISPALLPSAGPYRNIDHNPLTATEVVTFTPGRLQPSLVVGWSGFHCADPALPGTLTFAVGPQRAATGVTPGSCGPAGSPHSSLIAVSGITPISVVGVAPTPDNRGYWAVDQLGQIGHAGDAAAVATPAVSTFPVVGITAAPTGSGAWVVASDGGVFSYGSAGFHGSLGNTRLNAPIMGMAATPDGGGYWLVGADGGVFSFGDARFHGSLGNVHLAGKIVGMAATPDGGGYWLVGADGGVFTFGDAAFDGSLGNVLLNAPIVAMAAGPHGGYWLVGSDGGIFTFGGVPFKGSTGGVHLNAPISGMAATKTGQGYWLVGSDDGIFTFGNAGFFGIPTP